MKNIIKIAILLVISSVVALGQEVKVKNYDVANYDKIEVRNSVDVKLVANGKEGVTVECDERLWPAIKVEQHGSKLEIGLDWDKLKKITGHRRTRSVSIGKNKVKINGIIFEGGIKAIAYVKQIKEIKASSSGDVEWEGSLPTNQLYLRASSSGDITWTGLLEVNDLYVDCSSSGDVEGDYKGKNAIVELSSSGDFEGDIEVENLEVTLSSSADFVGKVKANEARFKLSSSGDAEVRGTIDSLYVKASSSADFYGKRIVYTHAEVKTSSSANIYLSKSGKVIDKTPKRTGVFVE